jgi:hypothetical protein
MNPEEMAALGEWEIERAEGERDLAAALAAGSPGATLLAMRRIADANLAIHRITESEL